MDITILVTKILGVYLVVSGLFLIVKGKTIPHLLKDFFNHPAIVYLTGIILIFLSSMYLIQYNIWDGSWKVIATIFAWIVMLKGLAYIFVPNMLNEMAIKKFKGAFSTYGVIAIIVGVYLFLLK
ncbi:hypothetical protein A2456_00095 [Candidatus Nomurabacteria bacterium RIFOXYC2_FULL_36_19]|uniref:Integral membrane protein (PIN domain superfamily) n=3 Tax=Candidatus Nomuraibacteriota TaxID=1752729 RepID=A0A1F6YTT6_9BACT|nr:MAG: hypothetical protein UR91_C0001G0009 [Candidatus Nomurabacteria bacterium GW2011_GWC2_35_8]OGJ05707.1 MAG: hypothetical protein A2238_00590 [Candidatus Nomurabacteria bacterium RIFOXYA2_FULL_35_9]OGJ06123.1 MAG: hypothetical protein A2192_01765 [Candidatus Nomurabacteria bacterium RIFOXYA1_FULL_35_17]OGJ09710.1 MAG: hypothetical protein A2456_00095 [Candidatus Nomurabacteria bacterium RIFOXYC2_FULL_36_19]OGJ14570.1 MAG: hypothetical protein A2554_02105 [Candidatus Nomurabacteria bacteri